MSKGSKRRPTDENKFRSNWEKIWGTDDEDPESTYIEKQALESLCNERTVAKENSLELP